LDARVAPGVKRWRERAEGRLASKDVDGHGERI
jgi:predicted secreted protein